MGRFPAGLAHRVAGVTRYWQLGSLAKCDHKSARDLFSNRFTSRRKCDMHMFTLTLGRSIREHSLTRRASTLIMRRISIRRCISKRALTSWPEQIWTTESGTLAEVNHKLFSFYPSNSNTDSWSAQATQLHKLISIKTPARASRFSILPAALQKDP